MTRIQNLMRRMLTCGLLAVASDVTAMQARGQGVTVRGAGTCQTYLDAKHSNSVQEAVKDLVWFMGYVSGLAVANHVDIFGKDDNADAMFGWVNAYCERYPAKYLSDAGDLYYRYRLEQMRASYPK
jgi:hypothetical protein